MANRSSPYNVEAALVMMRMSEALKLARKSRGETIEQAAGRVAVSASSIKRLESGDPELLASVGAGTLLSALCSYGFTNTLANAVLPEVDTAGSFLRQRAVMLRKKRK